MNNKYKIALEELEKSLAEGLIAIPSESTVEYIFNLFKEAVAELDAAYSEIKARQETEESFTKWVLELTDEIKKIKSGREEKV